MACDIHGYFGLTYAQYVVLDRTLLQSMPEEWQERFVAVLEEFDMAMPRKFATEYQVTTGEWKYCEEIEDEVLERLGYSHDEEADEYFDPDGHSTLYAFVPGPNPVPPYNRGRTRVEMNNG